MTTTVVLHDEGTRRVLEAALWHYAGSQVTRGDALDEDLSSVAIAVLGRHDFGTREELVPKVDQMVELLSSLRREVERLRSADIGESFVMPMSAEDLDSAIHHHVIPTVEEFEGFWEQPAGDRDRMLATRDAGARLRARVSSREGGGVMATTIPPTDPEAFAEWRRDPAAYEAMDRLRDAYDALVDALGEQVDATGLQHDLRASALDAILLAGDEEYESMRSARAEKGKVPPAPEQLLEARRRVEAAHTQWAAAVSDVDALLHQRQGGDE